MTEPLQGWGGFTFLLVTPASSEGATIQSTTQGEKQMAKFRTWDELSEVEQLQEIYSDTYKSAYGFRPRHATTEQWNSVKWLQEQLDFLENTQDPLDNSR